MSRLHRRQFLEDSMFAAASAVGVGTAGPTVHAEDSIVASANDTLSVAVVGVHGRGRAHLAAFSSRNDCEVTHICDVDEDVAQRHADTVRERQGRRPHVIQDIRKLLEDHTIDIVTIATPNHWHALAAVWSMQAGKDVYVEKPVSHNVVEGRVMVDVARKTERICQAGTQCRSNPGVRDAISFVRDGGIGEIRVARGLCYKTRGPIGEPGDFMPPRSVDYDLWSGPAQIHKVTRSRFHYDWHWQTPYGNGDLGNQGVHQMDLARWGLGVNELSQRVVSYGERFCYDDAADTPNTQVVMHDYGDKTLVFEVRGLSSERYRGANVGVIFEGSQGYVVLNTYSRGAAFDLDGNKGIEFSGMGDHFANFVQAVRSRKIEDLNADIIEGHLSSALCHLGNISYSLGETVSVPEAIDQLDALKLTEDVNATMQRFQHHLRTHDEYRPIDLEKTPFRLGPTLEVDAQQERLVGRDDANALLTREYRRPFDVPASSQV